MARGTVLIDQDRCKGCGLCPNVCPRSVLKIDENILNAKGYHPVTLVNAEDCTGCAVCAVICPDACLTVFREAPAPRRAASKA